MSVETVCEIPASRRRNTLIGAFLCLLFLFPLALSAQEPLSDDSFLIGERPTVNGEPTVIDISIFIFDIDEIDDVAQRFSIDMFLAARWRDPRLALPEHEREGKERFVALEDIWAPRVLFLNDRGLTPRLRLGATIDDLGNVWTENRLSGELAADLEFREFPFDVQRLPIEIVSYAYSTDELQFSLNTYSPGKSKRYSIEGWDLRLLEPEIGVFVAPPYDKKLPRLTFNVQAKRSSDYYVLTMLLPMSLIIFMAWTVFWLQPNIVPPRIAIATASIFSLIALGVSIRLGLPKVSYLTKADIFVIGCTLMVFLALGIAVIGSRWASSDRMEKALKANAISRWIYMVIFVLVAVAAIYH